MKNSKPDRPGSDALFVDSVQKAFLVLEAFSSQSTDLSLTEICSLTGMSKSAAQRFTHTLTALDYLAKNDASRRYALTPKILEIANSFLSVDPLVIRALPQVIELRRRLGMRIGMGCMRGMSCIYLIPLQSNEMAFRTANPGFTVPSFCSSTGRVQLAFIDLQEARRIVETSDRRKYTPYTRTDPDEIMDSLEEVRRTGFCITDNELVLGDINIAAPIFGKEGAVIAALTATGPRTSWTREALATDISPLITEAARAISVPR